MLAVLIDTALSVVAAAAAPNLCCLFCNFSSCSDFLSVSDVAAPKRSARFFRMSMGGPETEDTELGVVDEGPVIPNRAARVANLSAIIPEDATTAAGGAVFEDDTAAVELPNFLALNSNLSSDVNSEILISFFSGSSDDVDPSPLSFLSVLESCSDFDSATEDGIGMVTEIFRFSEIFLAG